MSNLFSNNFLANKPIEQAMAAFASRFKIHHRVLDIGCGDKPYLHYFSCDYVGLDPASDSKADVIGVAWQLPFKDGEFDGVILNQSLEHIAETLPTVNEIARVAKSGAYILVSVPHTMKNHGEPIAPLHAPIQPLPANWPYWYEDYYRFTKFGLLHLFRDFRCIEIRASNGYGASIAQLINYFFASLGHDWFFRPLYFFNNLWGSWCDDLFLLLTHTRLPVFTKIYEYMYMTLTINYILVAQKK